MTKVGAMICLALVSASASAAEAAQGEAPNPLLGSWAWNPTQGQCPETHRYSEDGIRISTSGEEVLESTYAVERIELGLYRLTTEVTKTNGKTDCTGHTTPVGAKATVYIQRLNSGSYLTCGSDDGMSCYGSATPSR